MYRKYRTGSSGYEPILTIACSVHVASVNVVERSRVIDTIYHNVYVCMNKVYGIPIPQRK